MAKKKEIIEVVENAGQTKDPFLSIDELLKTDSHKETNYGFIYGDAFEDFSDEKISTGSVRFDMFLGGGFRPGISLFYGDPETGKTAQALVWAKNWQDKYKEKAVVLFFDAEGRMTEYKLKQSGIDLGNKLYGCFRFGLYRGNLGERIYEIIEKRIFNNPNKYKYFFIIDSINAIQRIADKDKNYEDNAKIAGGASLNSMAYSRLSAPINCLGHHLYLCSQIRTQNIGGGGGFGGKGESAKPSGGKATQFYGDIIGRVHKGWSGTFITEKPSSESDSDKENSKAPKVPPLGNKTRIQLTKSYNETSNAEIDIPIKFKHIGGVWREYEAYMVAVEWAWVAKKGAWYEFTEMFREFCKDDNVEFKNVDLNKKIQGERNLVLLFEENADLVEYILAKMLALAL